MITPQSLNTTFYSTAEPHFWCCHLFNRQRSIWSSETLICWAAFSPWWGFTWFYPWYRKTQLENQTQLGMCQGQNMPALGILNLTTLIPLWPTPKSIGFSSFSPKTMAIIGEKKPYKTPKFGQIQYIQPIKIISRLFNGLLNGQNFWISSSRCIPAMAIWHSPIYIYIHTQYWIVERNIIINQPPLNHNSEIHQ